MYLILDAVKSSCILFGKEELDRTFNLVTVMGFADTVRFGLVDWNYRDSPVSAVSINAVPGIVQFL